MLNNKIVAVVVPAYNEEKQIGIVIETMPDYVDRIIIVNDCSKDNTANEVIKYLNNPLYNKKSPLPAKAKRVERNRYNQAEIVLQQVTDEEIKYYVPSEIVNQDKENDRIILINHLVNGGVGASIARGYKWCKDHLIDCTAVMAGDGQMDPDELEMLCKPVIDENIDYVKGNRLIHRSALLVIPKVRYFGNSILSILTKIASGYWHISDTQTGFTAISLNALQSIRIHKIYRSYGMPNDLLVKLNIAFCTIKEVEIKPIYHVGEKSKMKIFKVIPRISLLLWSLFFRRLWHKYLFRDFHPLFLLYNLGFILLLIDLPYIYKVVKSLVYGLTIGFEPLMAFLFLSFSSFQSLLFAMWMDIMDNERLYKS